MSKKKSYNFIIPLHIYPFDVMFSIGETDKQLKKVMDGIYETSDIHDIMDNLCLKKINAVGLVYQLPKGSHIVRLPELTLDPKQQSTINHEIFHVVSGTLSHIGVSLSIASEEAYAYLIGYITEHFYLNIKS